jgi:hypothetical protein
MAWAHLATNRLALIVDDGTDHHLSKRSPVVLAETSLADTLSALFFKVDRVCIEKN